MRIVVLSIAVGVVALSACVAPPRTPSQSGISAPQIIPTYAEFHRQYVEAARANANAHPSSVFNLLTGNLGDAAAAQAEVDAPAAYYRMLAIQRAALAGDIATFNALSAASPRGRGATAEESSAGDHSSPGQAAAGQDACPIGSHPWTDAWGNKICQSFATGGAVTTQVNAMTGCPTGAAPSVDSWGNRVCKDVAGGATYYDTSQGCPIGFHPWRDNWGNPTCEPT